ARANILALKSEATDEVFNVGMGVKNTINELVEMLLEITGSNLRPEYRPQEQMFVTHRVGSTEKAKRLFGFQAMIELKEGLRSVVEWRRRDQEMALVESVQGASWRFPLPSPSLARKKSAPCNCPWRAAGWFKG